MHLPCSPSCRSLPSCTVRSPGAVQGRGRKKRVLDVAPLHKELSLDRELPSDQSQHTGDGVGWTNDTEKQIDRWQVISRSQSFVF